MQRKGSEMSDDGEWIEGAMLDDWRARDEAKGDRIEQLEAAINAALERLDASLFTNAEHQQAKDILREATR